MTDQMLDERHTAMMLAAIFVAAFMDGLDGSIVNVALPTVGDSLGVDTATSSWVTITYMMVLAGTLVAFARISDQIGVRKIMAYGFAVFTVSSMFCGISVSFPMMIVSRIVQGIGASMMAAAGPMCCTKHLPPTRLAFGMSIVTIGESMGFALGPAIGGAIVEFASWHWCFLINIPLGVFMVPFMFKAIPASAESGDKILLDVKGTAVLCISIVFGVFAVETLSYAGMRIASMISGIACLVLFVLFIRIERDAENPLLYLGMFRRLSFSAVFLCLMMVNLSYMGLLYLIPFYGQIYLGMSALKIGMFLLFATLVTAAIGMPVARWSDVQGRRPFCIAAGIVVSVTFALYGILAEKMTDPELFIIMSLQGIGWALVGGPMASRLVEHSGKDRNMASSLINEAYFIGGAIGTAIAAMAFTTFSSTEGVDIMDVSRLAFVDGFVPTAYICTAFAIVVLILSAAVKDEKKDC